MAIKSRNKGKVGELELAHFLEEHGFPAARGQQFKGGPGSPDVVCEALGDFHIECKRVERADVEAWMAQACGDAGTKTPVVMHRKNKGEWMATVRLEDFLAMRMGLI